MARLFRLMFASLPDHHAEHEPRSVPKQCVFKREPKGNAMLNQITDSLNFQSDALRLRSERQRLLASNIANGDTPGYVAKDFDFSAVLRQATGQASAAQNPLNLSGQSRPSLAMAGTSGGHLQGTGQLAGQRTEPELSYSVQAMTNLDNNTVDMDRERANFTDNTVRYEATLRFINSQVKTLNTAITGQ